MSAEDETVLRNDDGKVFMIVGNDISDGFHTFGELYEHRCTLYVALCMLQPEKCRWRTHHINKICLYLETPAGQVSYHVPKKWIEVISPKIKQDQERAWDGHTDEDVLKRLMSLKEI